MQQVLGKLLRLQGLRGELPLKTSESVRVELNDHRLHERM